jgi:GNAT superfamily N-acetyltransferase
MRVEVGELVLVDSGLACDTFNVVCRARLAPETAGEAIRSAVAHFAEVGRPFSWWLCPGDEPSDLGARLIAAGLRRAEEEVAMAADLSALPPAEPSPDLRIVRVNSAEGLGDFARIVAAGWSPPDPDVLRFYELTAPALLAADSPIWLYVGYLAGAPVAAAELAEGGGVVGLYDVVTLAAYRRRGFGTALCHRALLDARARGFDTAVLQAQGALGLGVYGQLGFRPFGQVVEYKPAC